MNAAMGPPASCDVIDALPLSRARFESLVASRRFVDHRASGTVQLLAWAAGALPSPDSSPLMRRSSSSPTSDGSDSDAAGVDDATLSCAICRLVSQELELAASLVVRCTVSASPSMKLEALDLLLSAHEVLCEHMEARGQLGHTELRVRRTRPICGAVLARRRRATQAALEVGTRDAMRLSETPEARSPYERAHLVRSRLNLTAVACDGDDPRSQRAPTPTCASEVEMAGWPAALQFLLDHDDTRMASTLVLPKGRAATALLGSSHGGELRAPAHGGATQPAVPGDVIDAVIRSDGTSTARAAAMTNPQQLDTADDDGAGAAGMAGMAGKGPGEPPGGAASALLLLAASRSDVLVIKALCAWGVCSRALREPPSAPALAQVLERTALGSKRGGTRQEKVRRNELRGAIRRALQLHWSRTDDTVSAQGVPATTTDSSDPAAVLRADGALHGRQGLPILEHGRQGLHGRLSAVHVSAFLLDDEALAALLHHAPEGAHATDALGRTPLHFASHAAERWRGLVYLFTAQPFRTWLASHSASQVSFAPLLSRRNLTSELEGVQMATARLLLDHGASASIPDRLGLTPVHLAAAGGTERMLWSLAEAAEAAEARGGVEIGHDLPLPGRVQVAEGETPSGAAAVQAGGSGVGVSGDSGPQKLPPALISIDSSGRDAISIGAANDHVVGARDGGGPALIRSEPAEVHGAPPESDAAVVCDIDVHAVGSISPQEIEERYVLRGRPFALSGAMDSSWPASVTLQRPAFLKEYGEAVWLPQLLLPGNATSLAPYLRLAAVGQHRRPIAFNRPADRRLVQQVCEPAVPCLALHSVSWLCSALAACDLPCQTSLCRLDWI